MSTPRVVGLTPWLPAWLSRSATWSEPVPAERLAALRIGVALVLILDVALFYFPHADDFFGSGSLGSPEVFAGRFHSPRLNWSVLSGLESQGYTLAIIVWLLSAVGLLLGPGARFFALIAWVLAVSVFNANPYLHNGGDRVRTILLFYLMLAPCAAVWSLSLRRQDSPTRAAPVYVHPWSLRLLFFQMSMIYFMNGVYKAIGPGWRSGEVTHYLLQDLTWSRFVLADLSMPLWITQALTWLVVGWELCFPLLVLLPATRKPALWMGVAFHVGTELGLELGPFGCYMLCMYLPLLPWERWVRPRDARAPAAAA